MSEIRDSIGIMVAVLALERASSAIARTAAEAVRLPLRETEFLLSIATCAPVRRLDLAARLKRSTLPLDGLIARDLVVVEGPEHGKHVRLSPVGRKAAATAATALAELWTDASSGLPDDRVDGVLGALAAAAQMEPAGPGGALSSLMTVLRRLTVAVDVATVRQLKGTVGWPWETAPLRPLVLLATPSQASTIGAQLGITATAVRQALQGPIAAGLVVATRPHLHATQRGLEAISTITDASSRWWADFAADNGLEVLADARQVVDQLATHAARANLHLGIDGASSRTEPVHGRASDRDRKDRT